MDKEPPYNDEHTLLLSIAEGNEQAFSALFATWSTPLAAIAMKILKNEHARQEVVQEVFIKVWLHRDKLAKVENLGAWLHKVTVNQSLLTLQRYAAMDKRLAALQLTQDTTDHSSPLELKEIQRLVHKTIESLPPQRKMIYHMNRVEGKTTRQIAIELQLSHGYIRNALSVVMTAIRDRLTSAGFLLLIILLLL